MLYMNLKVLGLVALDKNILKFSSSLCYLDVLRAETI